MGPIALVGEAGGMRNVYVSGLLRGLGLPPQMVGAAYAVSSAAPTLAYFLNGQDEEAYRTWTRRLTKPEVFSLMHLVRLQRPANLDQVVEEICAELDVDRLLSGATPLTVGMVDAQSAACEYLTLSHDNYVEAIKATCAIPGVASPVMIDGRAKVDGALFDPLPVLRAIADGHRTIVVVPNKPHGFVPELPGVLMGRMLFAGMPQLRAALPKRIEYYAATWQTMLNPPEGVNIFVAAPEAIVPVDRFERDADALSRAYDQGVERGITLQGDLFSWLHQLGVGYA